MIIENFWTIIQHAANKFNKSDFGQVNCMGLQPKDVKVPVFFNMKIVSIDNK